jgi:hypothetical protein
MGARSSKLIVASDGFKEFEVGAVYEARTAASHGWRPRYTVVARTAKFITIEDADGRTKRVGVKNSPEGEWALPDGRYSMALTLRAERKVTEEGTS